MNFRKTNRIAVLLLLPGSHCFARITLLLPGSQVTKLCATPAAAADKLGITVE